MNFHTLPKERRGRFYKWTKESSCELTWTNKLSKLDNFIPYFFPCDKERFSKTFLPNNQWFLKVIQTWFSSTSWNQRGYKEIWKDLFSMRNQEVIHRYASSTVFDGLISWKLLDDAIWKTLTSLVYRCDKSSKWFLSHKKNLVAYFQSKRLIKNYK